MLFVRSLRALAALLTIFGVSVGLAQSIPSGSDGALTQSVMEGVDIERETPRVIEPPRALSLQVVGVVQRSDGSPMSGASVFTDLGGDTLTAADGRFTLVLRSIPDQAVSVEVYAVAADGSQSLQGNSGPVAVPTGSVLDAGVIVLQPLCPERWASGFGLPGLDGNVYAVTVYDDDGSGPNPPMLVAGGRFTDADGQTVNNIARWNPLTGSWSSFGAGGTGGVNGSVLALTVYDDDHAGPNPPQLVAGGSFTTAGGESARSIARWNPLTSSWSSFGTGNADGVTGSFASVVAITVYDDDALGPNPPQLFAGGFFTTAGGQPANNVARWNPLTNTWSGLGAGDTNGVNGSIYALTVFDSDGAGPAPAVLVAGGSFTSAGGQFARFLARWNLATNSWSAFGALGSSGVNGEVLALTVYDDDGSGPNAPALVVGGFFTAAGGQPANRVARWHPLTKSWSSFGAGSTNGVSGGSAPAVADLLVYDDDGAGPNPPVLLASGRFTTAGGQAASRVARWNPLTSSWSGFGTGISNGINDAVDALTVYDDDSSGPNPPEFVAAGLFISAGGQPANNIARWNPQAESWRSITAGNADGLNNAVLASTLYDEDGVGPARPQFVAAGTFTSAALQSANRIARFDPVTNSWSSFGTGSANGVNSTVLALTVYDSDGSGPNPPMLVAGGEFTAAGGQAAAYVARWNPVTNAWSSFGVGNANGVDFTVYALTVYDDDDAGPNPPMLVAGGFFISAGGQPANRVARWNPLTNSWSSFGTGNANGMNNAVTALTVYDDDGAGPNPPLLVAGGIFGAAGGQPATRLARWNPLTNSWASFGTGSANGVGGSGFPFVSALTVYDDDDSGPNPPMLVASGLFTSAGGQHANCVARWNPLTSSWSSFGIGTADGMNEQVRTLTVYDDDGVGPNPPMLVAGGDFTTAGGNAANRVARWSPRTSSWSSLSAGSANGVTGGSPPAIFALTAYDARSGSGDLPRLFVGGAFTSAGGGPSWYIAEWSRPTSCSTSSDGEIDAPGLALLRDTFAAPLSIDGDKHSGLRQPGSRTVGNTAGDGSSGSGTAGSIAANAAATDIAIACISNQAVAERLVPGSRLHLAASPSEDASSANQSSDNATANTLPPPADPGLLDQLSLLVPAGSPWRLVWATPVAETTDEYDAEAAFNGESRRVRVRVLPPGDPCCDIDRDGVVGFADLVETLRGFGQTEPDTDLNLDGMTDLADLVVVLQSWSAEQGGGADRTDDVDQPAIEY